MSEPTPDHPESADFPDPSDSPARSAAHRRARRPGRIGPLRRPRWSSRPGRPGGRSAAQLTTAIVLQGVLPVAILGAGALGVWWLFRTTPKAERGETAQQARLVEVAQPGARARRVTVEAMGTVRPARRIEMTPRVSGQLVRVDPRLIPGGRFAKGQTLMRIDRRDYELAIEQQQQQVKIARSNVSTAQYQLAQAKRDLKLEQGSQAVAQAEYKLLDDEVTAQNRSLMLREPQLKAAQQSVEAAQAGIDSAKAQLKQAESQLKQAKLNLQRTTIEAPFDAMVQEKLVDVGDSVSTGTQLVQLIGTDVFWVELAVPESDLQWIDVPSAAGTPATQPAANGKADTASGKGQANPPLPQRGAGTGAAEPDRRATEAGTGATEPTGEVGSKVRLFNAPAWGPDRYRTGRVIRRLPMVQNEGRMARLLVRVTDPLALKPDHSGKPPLLVGSYLEARITGRRLDRAVSLPRDWIRSGNEVWLMNESGELAIQTIDPIYKGPDYVLVDGDFGGGRRIVTSDLMTPVAGMPLRVEPSSRTARDETSPRQADAEQARKQPEARDEASPPGTRPTARHETEAPHTQPSARRDREEGRS